MKCRGPVGARTRHTRRMSPAAGSRKRRVTGAVAGYRCALQACATACRSRAGKPLITPIDFANILLERSHVWQHEVMSLDGIARLAEVGSALCGLVGLIFTAIGLRQQREGKTPSSGAAPLSAGQPKPTAGTAPDVGPHLDIPERSEWVPSSDHLPGPAPSGGALGWYGQASIGGYAELPERRRRLGLLVAGLALLTVAVAALVLAITL